MADLDKIKGNLGKMIDQGAPKEHLDAYLASEGFDSPDKFRAAVKAPINGDNLARSFGTGVLFNHGDEAAAAVRAAFPKISNWMMRPGPETAFASGDPNRPDPRPEPQTVSDKPTYDERYSDELAVERQKQKDFETAHPNVDLAAKLAGGMASTVLGARAMPGLFSPVVGSGPITALTGNVLKGAAVGGGMGAVSGFGDGEGGFGNRATNALTGAAVGATLGGTLPVLGVGGRALMETPWGQSVARNVLSPAVRFTGNKVYPVIENTADALLNPQKIAESGLAPFGRTPFKSLSAAAADGGSLPPSGMNAAADRLANVAQEGSDQRIATAIQRSGKPVEYWVSELKKHGPEATLADLDPQFLNLAVGVKTLEGDTKSLALNVLKPRMRNASARMGAAAEGDEPPPSDFLLRGKDQAFDQNLRQVGQRAYGAMDEAGLKQTPELMEIYKNEHVGAAINKVMAAEKSTRVGTDTPPASPVDIMHKVKQAIWDLGFDKETARPGPNASFYRNLGTKFVDRLKAANPELAAADKAYATAASLPEYYDAGNALFTGGTGEKARETSGPALDYMLGRATDPNQPLAARAGATNAMRAKGQTTNQVRARARDIDQSGDLRAKIEQLYSPAHAAKIMQMAETEGIFNETERRLLGGPHTADDLVSALSNGGSSGLRVSNTDVKARAFEKFADIINRAVNPNMSVRNAMGRSLINTDAESNQDALRRAAAILAKRGRGNALSPGIIGAGAETGGSY